MYIQRCVKSLRESFAQCFHCHIVRGDTGIKLKLPTISKHLKVLQRAGLISKERRAQWRPCRLEPAPLLDVARFLERYTGLWAEQHQRLDQYLQEMQLQEETDGEDQGEVRS